MCIAIMATRPCTYSTWPEISMTNAIKAVEEEGLTVRLAAELYGIPKSTLYDRIRGNVQHGTKPGPVPYLTKEEEVILAKFLIKCSQIGFPRTVSEVLAL
uniref:HTH psq-type domain-containing protein n=1 Tax=Amphimedon queenslandica TaxID=400682 RepID=A0A1X7SP45_AMPQE